MRLTGNAWVIVGLLFLCQVINFFDKSVLGLAAGPIMAELNLTRSQYGLVASSFYALYALSGVGVGLFVISRMQTKWVLVILVLIWSLAQLPIAFTSSLSVLVACRVVLGIGEGPATSAAINLCFGWFPSAERTLPNAVVMLGAGVGTLIGAPVLTYFILSYGWRSAFLLCGGLGIAWLLVWLAVGADGPLSKRTDFSADPDPAPVERLPLGFWLDPTILASITVGFCAYWATGFSVAWLPSYIRSVLGYDQHDVGWLMSAISGSGAGLSFILAWVSQRLLQSGVPSRLSRGALNGISLLVGGVLLMTSLGLDGRISRLILLAIGFGLPLVTFNVGPAIAADLAPPTQRGRVLLIIYSGITIAGFFAPLATGYLVGDVGLGSGGYGNALLLNAAVLIVGGLVGTVWLRPAARPV